MLPILPRRSALYVPGANRRAIEKARGLAADVIILDLEDSVAPEAKEEARANVAAALGPGRAFGNKEIVVRINALSTSWGAADLSVAAALRPDAILLPKVEDAAGITEVRRLLVAGGPSISIAKLALWAMIETPRAVLDPLPIATTHDARHPLTALVLGLNDLSRETRTRLLPGRAAMLPFMMNALAAARVGGLDILDGTFNDFHDMDGFEAECEAARDGGFDGKTLIHPAQIGPANRIFAPGAEEIAWAERIVEAFGRPENYGRGVVGIDGKMVERLHLAMAERTLALAAAIDAEDLK